MTVDKVVREIVRSEVERIIAPLAAAVESLQHQGTLAQKLTALLGEGGRYSDKRGPGRPKGALHLGLSKRLALKPMLSSKKRIRVEGANDRPCALIGCKRDARSKGYCAAHYQKLRMLARTGRLPLGWTEYAPAHSVKDIVLPRGRAGAKALAAARKTKR